MRVLRYVPVVFLGLLIWVLWKGLNVGEPLASSIEHSSAFPSFSLADVREPQKLITAHDLEGKLSIVHIWATWCGICLQEHDEWVKILQKWPYPFVGVVYRDDTQSVLAHLKHKSDPYTFLLNDASGKLGLDLGLKGTPQTYIVDAQGIIRFHHLGAIDRQIFEKELLPVLKQYENIGQA